MASFDDYLGAHETLFAHYEALTDRLSDEQLAVPSLCPGWSVRDVIGHVIGAEAWLTGWEPSDQEPPPFDRMAEFAARVEGVDRARFAELVAEASAARLDHLRSLGPAALDQPSFTPAGIHTYRRFLQVRIFDLWVHQRDIAIPLGETTDDSGFAAETALQEVADSIGYIVGKKIGLADGRSIAFRIRGPVERDILVAVDGRAGLVESLDAPDVEVTADVGTFVLLAAGRVDPQERIDAGSISWTGNDEWGERAARNLAYTT